VPSLASLALRQLLLTRYDDASCSIIEQALLDHVPLERIVGLVCDPAVFAAMAPYPHMTDALRCQLAAKPKAGRRLLEVLLDRSKQQRRGFGSPRALEQASASLAVCERLLCASMFKRDIHGPLLPTEHANLVRAVRKQCHRVIPAQDGIGHFRPEAKPGVSWRAGASAGDPDYARALRAYDLRRLDQWTG